ncbi:hypothetical protein [Streptomyces cyaneofuscatus]|uniref:hypothetical protein n=1 Tax=Streptomyces cyaneofuscatus TaxID=66883 RepID=UPI0033AED16C
MPDTPSIEEKFEYALTALMNYQDGDSRGLENLGGEFHDRLLVAALDRCVGDPVYGQQCLEVKNHILERIAEQNGASDAQNWSEWVQDKFSSFLSHGGSYVVSFRLDAASHLYGAVGVWESMQSNEVRDQIKQQWLDLVELKGRWGYNFDQALQRISPDFPPHPAEANDVSIASAARFASPQSASRPSAPPPAYERYTATSPQARGAAVRR